MLIALYRRAPRTKATIDRISSRRHSSIDSSCSFDHQPESNIISNTNNQDICQNHLDLTRSTLPQYNDVYMSSNGQDDSTVSFNGDINDNGDSDEYAYFILHCRFLIFFLPSLFILLVQYHQVFVLLGCFLIFFYSSFIDYYLSGEKHELRVRLIIDKVYEEVHHTRLNLFHNFKNESKKCKYKRKKFC